MIANFTVTVLSVHSSYIVMSARWPLDEFAMTGQSLPMSDDEGFSAFVEEHQQRIGRYLYSLVGNVEDARDLTQDVFLRAYRARHQLRSQESAIIWLFSIASNMAKDYHRRKHRLSFLPWEERVASIAIDPDPAQDLGERELVGAALARLPKDMARCLLLYEVEGFTAKEVAQIVGIKPDAARQRIVRARRLFKQAYESLSEGGQP